MIALRGHHLVCLHFFKGKGYNEKFTKTLKGIINDLKRKKPLKLVDGADDLCIACPHLKNQKCSYSKNAEKEVREMDSYAINKLKVSSYAILDWEKLKSKVEKITPIWKDKYCKGCDFEKTCWT